MPYGSGHDEDLMNTRYDRENPHRKFFKGLLVALALSAGLWALSLTVAATAFGAHKGTEVMRGDTVGVTLVCTLQAAATVFRAIVSGKTTLSPPANGLVEAGCVIAPPGMTAVVKHVVASGQIQQGDEDSPSDFYLVEYVLPRGVKWRLYGTMWGTGIVKKGKDNGRRSRSH
jgi:hypothetical protein